MAGGDLLFGREFVLTIGTKRIAVNPEPTVTTDAFGNLVASPSTIKPLRVDFKVVKTKGGKPNKAQVTIYNLRSDTRVAMQEEAAQVVIEAGYAQTAGQIFRGKLKHTNTERKGADWITTFQANDGGVEQSTARINETFAVGTQLKDVMQKVAESIGVDVGNASEAFKAGNFRKGFSEFTKGTTVSGKSVDILNNLVRSAGLEASIQDEKLQIVPVGEGTTDDVQLLSPATGLIGSPEIGEKQIVKVTSLLRSVFFPGLRIKIESAQIDGTFIIQKLQHKGSTYTKDWFTDMECKEA